MSILQLEIERALVGTTIAELARQWGVPRWVIDDIINRRMKMPGAKYLVAIARGLGKSVEELVTPEEVSA